MRRKLLHSAARFQFRLGHRPAHMVGDLLEDRVAVEAGEPTSSARWQAAARPATSRFFGGVVLIVLSLPAIARKREQVFVEED